MPSILRWIKGDQGRWRLALAGQFLAVFAAVGLSGPGRIDIVDGQARYETARSLLDHGDLIIRQPDLWFSVMPGRGGNLYSSYRFPQSAAGVCAIWSADLSGPVREARRHFFFSLIGAVACGLLAVAYSVWFRGVGLLPISAMAWSTAGIFCTPNWYYGTSTFDDILGTVSIVLAVTLAHTLRSSRPMLGATISGLLLGWAFNCKQPLGAFLPAVLASQVDPGQPMRVRWRYFVVVLIGLVVGIVFYTGYDWYKFPPGSREPHSELIRRYAPNFPGNPAAALLGLSLSPGAGVVWYSPATLIAVCGISGWMQRDRLLCLTILAGASIFVAFLSSMTIFKGDPTWGPRYLTPVLALLWLFAPAGAARLRRRRVVMLLAAGVLVQVAGLSVDPHRLYIEQRLPSAFGVIRPWMYFNLNVSHLAQRPRELWEILVDERQPAGKFSPSPSPTFAFPIIDEIAAPGPAAARRYHVLDSLRPWWASQWYLEPTERPVDLPATAFTLLAAFAGGLGLAARSIPAAKQRESPEGS